MFDKRVTLGACGLSVALLAPTALAQTDRASASEKGSVLIIPKIELRWAQVDGAGPWILTQDTFVHLTNDYPGDVLVKMYFINGDAPTTCGAAQGPQGGIDVGPGLGGETERVNQGQGGGEEGCEDHPGWNWVDNVITLTMDEPAYWSAFTGLPKGVSPWQVLDPHDPPGRPDPDGSEQRVLRGYVVAWAINAAGEEIRWNHLAATATIVNYTPLGHAWGYNAYAFASVNNAIAHGQPTGTAGTLNLNGVEFAQSYSQLLMNFQAVGSNAYSHPMIQELEVITNTDLTLLPVDLDVRQETQGPAITKASYDIWNENEWKFTNADRCIECWDQRLLSNYGIPNHFLLEFLQTDHGKARIEGLQSALCPGSQARSLLGLRATLMAVGGVPVDNDRGIVAGASAVNLIGMGAESATIQYDVGGPPPENGLREGSFQKYLQELGLEPSGAGSGE